MRALLVLIAFVGVPLLEIFVLIQVGQVIGVWWALALILAISVGGAYLVKSEGRRAWRELQRAIQAGRLPDRELLNAGLVLVGGTLLLTPGFVTDALGLALMFPLTRPIFNAAARWAIGRQVAKRIASMPHQPGRAPGSGAETGDATSEVIIGEVIEPSDRQRGADERPDS